MEANLIGPMEDYLIEATAEPSISNTSLTHLTINDPALLASLSLPALLSLDIGDIGYNSCLPFIPPSLTYHSVLLPDCTFGIQHCL